MHGASRVLTWSQGVSGGLRDVSEDLSELQEISEDDIMVFQMVPRDVGGIQGAPRGIKGASGMLQAGVREF